MKTLCFIFALLLALLALAGPTAPSTKALGSPTAPITIDLYADFQCPHCKDFHDEAVGPLIADYVNTGKVYLVRHYFVLKFPYSRLSAQYACAAERIGKYNPVAEILFKTQQTWGQSGKVDEVVSSVLSPADAAKVRSLAKDPSVDAEIEKDTQIGIGHNVNQTPTVFIKGRMLMGLPSEDAYYQAIDEALRGK